MNTCKYIVNQITRPIYWTAYCILFFSIQHFEKLGVNLDGLVVKVLDSIPGVPFSKPLCGSKVDSAFHPSEVNIMSTGNFWELSVKKVNYLLKVALALKQSNPIYKKGA